MQQHRITWSKYLDMANWINIYSKLLISRIWILDISNWITDSSNYLLISGIQILISRIHCWYDEFICWYQQLEFLISRIRILDITIGNVDIKNYHYCDAAISNSISWLSVITIIVDNSKSISWYQECVHIVDINSSNSWYQRCVQVGVKEIKLRIYNHMNKIENEISSYEKKKNNKITRIKESH